MRLNNLPSRPCSSVLLVLLLLLLLAACGGAGAETAVLPTPTLSPQLAQGQKVFVAHCGACHSTAADTIIVGPSLAGIAQRGAQRIDGFDARTYIYSSIMQPDDYVVQGFDNLMPKDLAKKLTGEELDAVVAYLLAQPQLQSGEK